MILRAVGSLRVFLFFCLAAAFNVAASDECVEVGVQGAKRVVECEFSFFARVPESNRGKGLEPLEGLNKVNKKNGGGRRMPTGRGIARAAPKMRLKMSLFPLRAPVAMHDVL